MSREEYDARISAAVREATQLILDSLVDHPHVAAVHGVGDLIGDEEILTSHSDGERGEAQFWDRGVKDIDDNVANIPTGQVSFTLASGEAIEIRITQL